MSTARPCLSEADRCYLTHAHPAMFYIYIVIFHVPYVRIKQSKKKSCVVPCFAYCHLRVRFTQAEILSSQIRELPEFQCAAFGFHYTTPYPSQHDTCGRLHVHGSSKVQCNCFKFIDTNVIKRSNQTV